MASCWFLHGREACTGRVTITVEYEDVALTACLLLQVHLGPLLDVSRCAKRRCLPAMHSTSTGASATTSQISVRARFGVLLVLYLQVVRPSFTSGGASACWIAHLAH